MFKVGDVVRFRTGENAKVSFPNEYRITHIEDTGSDKSRHMIFFKGPYGTHGGYYAGQFELAKPEKSKEEKVLLKIKYLNQRFNERKQVCST